ncbi:tetraacyldisaccharide 4'-kinase [Candidatus Pelagibacter sp.]|nr:tetraacyldisaccharide 4'-kinase [Candidatus Pelagibacter sp.]
MNLKKPKFWDYKKPNIVSILLFPVTLLIKSISFLRITPNLRSTKIKTICVGNIYIGGTGKTSLCIKLNEILSKKKIKSCFIKKFYKNQHDEQSILKKNGELFLSRDRFKAIKQAEEKNYKIAIIDDGLQDNSINYNIRILCFNNINWIGNGMTIPSGPLREDVNSIKKYEHIFLNGNLENLEELKKKILRINSNVNIHVGVYEPININEFNKDENYIIFSGIGNHQTFLSMLKKYNIKIYKDYEFPDHYQYTTNDIDQIVAEANKSNCKIITTEKDFIRLSDKNIHKIRFIKSKLNIVDEEKLLKSII